MDYCNALLPGTFQPSFSPIRFFSHPPPFHSLEDLWLQTDRVRLSGFSSTIKHLIVCLDTLMQPGSEHSLGWRQLMVLFIAQ